MKTFLIAVLCVVACGGKDAVAPKNGAGPTATGAASPAAADRITVIVTLAGTRPKQDVRHELEQAGFVLQQDLDKTDIFIGTARPDTLPALRAVAGVTAVERDQPVSI
jgi:hypothetical protein